MKMWELDYKEGWMPKNWCFWIVVLEKTFESPLDNMEIKRVNPKANQPWMITGRTLKLKFQYFSHLMWRANSLERTPMLGNVKAGREGDNRGWDGWMASPTQWIWVWASFRRWWWTGKPGMLRSVGSQRVGHDWVNKNNTSLYHLVEVPLSIFGFFLYMDWK